MLGMGRANECLPNYTICKDSKKEVTLSSSLGLASKDSTALSNIYILVKTLPSS